MSNIKMGLTIEEAAECTGIGRNTMRKLVDWGKLPVLKVGRKAIIRRDTLERFMSVNQGRNLLNENDEQIIILVFLIIALGITLWLYISKAKKQVKYRGDERWQLIQLKASNAANLAHSILIVLIAVLPLFINMQTTVTLQRVSIFALLYIGIRNLIELVATIYFDKRL